MNSVARGDKGQCLGKHQIPRTDVGHIKSCMQCSRPVDRGNRPTALGKVLHLCLELINKFTHTGYKGTVDGSVQIRFFIAGEAGRMQRDEVLRLVEIAYECDKLAMHDGLTFCYQGIFRFPYGQSPAASGKRDPRSVACPKSVGPSWPEYGR